jgi:hypothetical protein
MEDKYTLRDFLVYFTTGLYLLLVLLEVYNLQLLRFFNVTKGDIKDNQAIIIFLLLPTLYLLGHFIHGVDLLLYKAGRFFWDLKSKHNKQFKIVSFIILILNGYRITGMLDEKGIVSHKFWIKVSKLQLEQKFDKVEYWYLMNDLLKGLTLISFVWSIYSLISFSIFAFLYTIFLTFIFWFRARHMVVNFVSAVQNTYTAFESIEHKATITVTEN